MSIFFINYNFGTFRENKSSKDSKSTEENPKDQRERKPRPAIQTNVTINPNNETVEVDFSNLKKETDEIKRLTDSSKYSKREISSNWSRYEKSENEDEFTSAADFSSLLQAPVSGGGHFQFKSEKHWDVKIKSQYSEYFSLNLKTINDGILSIPFYERHCINSALLNVSIKLIKKLCNNKKFAIKKAILNILKAIEYKL